MAKVYVHCGNINDGKPVFYKTWFDTETWLLAHKNGEWREFQPKEFIYRILTDKWRFVTPMTALINGEEVDTYADWSNMKEVFDPETGEFIPIEPGTIVGYFDKIDKEWQDLL